jgi:hypothetical protein
MHNKNGYVIQLCNSLIHVLNNCLTCSFLLMVSKIPLFITISFSQFSMKFCIATLIKDDFGMWRQHTLNDIYTHCWKTQSPSWVKRELARKQFSASNYSNTPLHPLLEYMYLANLTNHPIFNGYGGWSCMAK